MLWVVDWEGVAYLPEDADVEEPREERQGPDPVRRKQATVRQEVEHQVERYENDHHEQHQVDGEVPVEEPENVDWLASAPSRDEFPSPRAPFQILDDLEDDELEEGAGKTEVDTEYDLDDPLPQLIVPKKFLDEEDPSYDKEHSLRRQYAERVLQQGHDGPGAVDDDDDDGADDNDVDA